MVNGAFGTGVGVFGTFLVADGWFCSCASDGGVFGVKICPTAREMRCRGFVDFRVAICLSVVVSITGVAEIGEFWMFSAVPSCVLSLSKGISGFPGLRVSGAISGLFSGKVTICV